MIKTEKTMSNDYGLFISIAGIGGIVSCALLMVGFGLDQASYGYIAAAVTLLVTVVFLIGSLKKAKLNASLYLVNKEANYNGKSGVARMMTSPDGDVVYANNLATRLYQKYGLGLPQSPLKIDISSKQSLKIILNELEIGKSEFVISEVAKTGEYLKFEVEKIYKNGDFYTWRITESAESEGVLNRESYGLNGYLNLGLFFEKSNAGFLVINDSGMVTYLNEYLSHKIFAESTKPELPFSLSLICKHSSKNLIGRVQFNSKSGSLYNANLKEWNLDNKTDDACYLVIDEEKNKNGEINKITAVGVENSVFLKSPIGIAVVDDKGKIKDKNIIFGNFIAELGLDERDNLKDILIEENATSIFKEIKNTLNSGKSSEMIELNLKGESDKQGKLFITCSDDRTEKDHDVIIYLIDITEQKKLELQFSQSQKMQAVGQLAGGVAHDFNNLLTAITGFSDLLLVKHGPGDQSFSDIIQIKQNANRAANLVRQLLAFSRQQTLRPKVLIMTDVVAELSNLLRRLIGSNIELEMNHGRNIDPVRVDQGQLEQVIINLCVNARDAMPDGGHLEVKTKNISVEDSKKVKKQHQIFPLGEYVLLEVIDNGSGIEAKHIGKVFEPFFSTKDIGKGTGLGLSTVYGIIKQTNGFVFLDSEIGVGTSFKIYLPKHIKDENEDVDDVPQEAPVEEKARDLTGSSTILLVEDEDAVRMFASRALKNKGYTVYEADSGVSALQVMEEIDVTLDLLISDVMMPQMDGPTLVKKIRETDKELKVIFISGYAEDALDDDVMDQNFHFLAKPFSLKQLAEQVKEVLEK